MPDEANRMTGTGKPTAAGYRRQKLAQGAGQRNAPYAPAEGEDNGEDDVGDNLRHIDGRGQFLAAVGRDDVVEQAGEGLQQDHEQDDIVIIAHILRHGGGNPQQTDVAFPHQEHAEGHESPGGQCHQDALAEKGMGAVLIKPANVTGVILERPGADHRGHECRRREQRRHQSDGRHGLIAHQVARDQRVREGNDVCHGLHDKHGPQD